MSGGIECNLCLQCKSILTRCCVHRTGPIVPLPANMLERKILWEGCHRNILDHLPWSEQHRWPLNSMIWVRFWDRCGISLPDYRSHIWVVLRLLLLYLRDTPTRVCSTSRTHSVEDFRFPCQLGFSSQLILERCPLVWGRSSIQHSRCVDGSEISAFSWNVLVIEKASWRLVVVSGLVLPHWGVFFV